MPGPSVRASVVGVDPRDGVNVTTHFRNMADSIAMATGMRRGRVLKSSVQVGIIL